MKMQKRLVSKVRFNFEIFELIEKYILSHTSQFGSVFYYKNVNHQGFLNIEELQGYTFFFENALKRQSLFV